MKIKPLADRVIVQPSDAAEGTSAGGIIIPDTVNKERPQVGEVIALGDDIVNKDLERKPVSQIVSVGDQVLFAKYGGTEVTVDDEDYLLVNRTDILGVLEK